ncbi:MAG: hypothetical protein WC728_05540 [Elusimicrobiota bacterium]
MNIFLILFVSLAQSQTRIFGGSIQAPLTGPVPIVAPVAPLASPIRLTPSLSLPGGSLSLPSVARPSLQPMPASPLGAIPVGESAVVARDFSNAYGFYSWLSELNEVQGTPRPELAKARLLIEASGLLSQGPVFVMKEGARLTLLSSKDPDVPPVVLSLSRESLDEGGASPQARFLAERLEAAAAADKAEGGFFNKAALLNRLEQAIQARPAVAKPGKGIETGEMPLDPLRQPWEYLSRMLRDAMRSTDPYEVLDKLREIKSEIRRVLNAQDGGKFYERLRSQAELQARVFVPALLEAAQKAAGDNDKDTVEKTLKAAFEFAQYAPTWRKRVEAAHTRAHDTLKLIELYGPIDPETGLPVKLEEPQ